MCGELHLETKGLLADGAFKVPDLFVNRLVVEDQRLLEREPLGADRTNEVPVVIVDALDVKLQGSFLSETLSTGRTRERLQSFVDGHDMFQQVALQRELLPAMGAQVLLFLLHLLLLLGRDVILAARVAAVAGDPLDMLDVDLDLDLFDFEVFLLDVIRAQHFDRIDQSQDWVAEVKAIKQGSFIFITFGTPQRPRFRAPADEL